MDPDSLSYISGQRKIKNKFIKQEMNAVDTLAGSVRKCFLHSYQSKATCFKLHMIYSVLYSSSCHPSILKRATSEQHACVYT